MGEAEKKGDEKKPPEKFYITDVDRKNVRSFKLEPLLEQCEYFNSLYSFDSLKDGGRAGTEDNPHHLTMVSSEMLDLLHDFFGGKRKEEIRIDLGNVFEVLTTARYLLIKDLELMCCEFLESDGICTRFDYLYLYHQAERTDCERLKAYIKSTVHKTVRRVRDRSGFGKCDLELVLDPNVSIPCHKDVVSSCSAVLKKDIAKVLGSAKDPPSPLQLDMSKYFDSSLAEAEGFELERYQALAIVVDFMYTGTITEMDPSMSGAAMEMAWKLKVDQLEDEIAEHFVPLNDKLCKEWYAVVLRSKKERLLNITLLHMCKMFKSISSQISTLYVTHLETILKSDYVNASELEILNAVFLWMTVNKTDVPRLLSHIRFQQIDLPASGLMESKWRTMIEKALAAKANAVHLPARFWPKQLLVVEMPHPGVRPQKQFIENGNRAGWMSRLAVHAYDFTSNVWAKQVTLGFQRDFAVAHQSDASLLHFVEMDGEKERGFYKTLDLNLGFGQGAQNTQIVNLKTAGKNLKQNTERGDQVACFCRNEELPLRYSTMTQCRTNEFALFATDIKPTFPKELMYWGRYNVKDALMRDYTEKEEQKYHGETRLLYHEPSRTTYAFSSEYRSNTRHNVTVMTHTAEDGALKRNLQFPPEKKSTLPFGASYAFYDDDTIVRVGGWDYEGGSNPGETELVSSRKTVHLFSRKNLKFKFRLPDLNEPRDSCGLVRMEDGRLIAVGGLNRKAVRRKGLSKALFPAYEAEAVAVNSMEVLYPKATHWVTVEKPKSFPHFKCGYVAAFEHSMSVPDVMQNYLSARKKKKGRE